MVITSAGAAANYNVWQYRSSSTPVKAFLVGFAASGTWVSVATGTVAANASQVQAVPVNPVSGNNGVYKITSDTPIQVQLGSGGVSESPWANQDWFSGLTNAFATLNTDFRFASYHNSGFGSGNWVTAIAPVAGTQITLTAPGPNIAGRGNNAAGGPITDLIPDVASTSYTTVVNHEAMSF